MPLTEGNFSPILRNGIEYVKAVHLCGHSDFYPVNTIKNFGAKIAASKCEDCRCLEACENGGHLGTGQLYATGPVRLDREYFEKRIAERERV